MNIHIFAPTEKRDTWQPRMGVIGWEGDDLYFAACVAGMFDAEALAICTLNNIPAFLAEGTVLVPEKFARLEAPERSVAYDAVRQAALRFRNSTPAYVIERGEQKDGVLSQVANTVGNSGG